MEEQQGPPFLLGDLRGGGGGSATAKKKQATGESEGVVRVVTVAATEGTTGLRVKRRYPLGHPFWEEGDLARELVAKQCALDLPSDDAAENEGERPIKCPMPGCKQKLRGVAAFEAHYNSVHKHTCTVCSRVFPMARLLELHVLESHDSMFVLLARSKKMYECLVEGCGHSFWRDSDRKRHLVDLHHYPSTFYFHPPPSRSRRFHRRRQRRGKETKADKERRRQAIIKRKQRNKQTGQMMDEASELLAKMDVQPTRKTRPETESKVTPTEAPTNEAAMEESCCDDQSHSRRKINCRIPDSLSFGGRGKGKAGRGRNNQVPATTRGGSKNRGRGTGRGRGRGRGKIATTSTKQGSIGPEIKENEEAEKQAMSLTAAYVQTAKEEEKEGASLML
ncbi:Zinc ion binding,nucleic acid binding,zinc ion binding [Balamuthia mandrillaris]